MSSRLVQALSHAARKAPVLTRDFTSTSLTEEREAVGEDVGVEAAFGADAIPQLGPLLFVGERSSIDGGMPLAVAVE